MTWTNPTLYTPGSPSTPAATSTDWLNFFTNNLAALMPVGGYVYMHANPGSSGLINGCYIECNGQAISRTTYATLFALVGTTYGSGDGSTTFNVPDAAGRMLIGAAGASGNADVQNLGQTDGNTIANRTVRHYHTVAETTHGHTGSMTVGSTNSAHTHITSDWYDLQTSVGDAIPGGVIKTLDSINYTTASGAATHSHSVSGLAGSSDSGGVTVTPGGSQPVDSPAYLCAGVLFIKVL